MSHQPSRTSDIASEWPEERGKRSSKSKQFKLPATSVPTTAPKPPVQDEVNPKVGDVDMNVEKFEEWDGRTCLFCPLTSSTLDLTLSHMISIHNLSIPDEGHLIVDVETLLSYCHVIIHSYLECPVCGTQRQTLKPLQAHMRDKGHCGLDVGEGSDFRAFYDWEDGDGGSEGENHGRNGEKMSEVGCRRAEPLEELGDGQVRLPSGKVIGGKAYRAPRPVQEPKASEVEVLQDGPNQSPTLSLAGTAVSSSAQTTALTRADKRNLSSSKALTQLRREDQLQLAHLPAAQQRAVLSTQKKQVAKERRAQQWMDGRLRGKGNKFLQANYRADGPGRANG